MTELTTPQEENRTKGEESSRRHLDFGEESCKKNLEYTGLLETLNNRFDKKFARGTIIKLLENVMCKEIRRQTRHVKKRQPSRLPKRIREIRGALNGDVQGTETT